MRTHYGPWQPCWISNQHQKHKSGRGPSSEHFWQVWLISVQRFQRRRFKCEKLTDGRTTTHDKSSQWPMARWAKNQPIRNKNRLWWPRLLMDRDEMSNLYRGPPIDDTYQVSVHLAKRFQRRRYFRNQPIRNKNCLWRPCLLTDRDEMSIFTEDLTKMLSTKLRFIMSKLYRGPSIDASYQVSVHLAKGFQRRRLKCEKLTDDGWQKFTLPLARWAKNAWKSSSLMILTKFVKSKWSDKMINYTSWPIILPNMTVKQDG